MAAILRRLGFTSFAFWFGSVGAFMLGAAFMLVAFPFIFPPPVLNEAAPTAAMLAGPEAGKQEIAFEFDQKAPGRDLIHWANGSGKLIRTKQGWLLRLEKNFEAGPGPNYWIYFNTRGTGEEKDFLADKERVKFAPLRAFKGAQNYPLPMTIDPEKYHSVTIWCETFGVYIGSAILKKS